MSEKKVPFLEKVSYGFGDFASVLYWQTFMAYLLIFYTDVFGISAATAGTMFLVSRLWDGVNDPMIGVFADRTETRWGKFRPYILWFSLPFVIMGVLTFTTPGFGETGRTVWAYVTFNLLMMLYTAVNIPYTALLGVISSNPVDRTAVASIKFLFAYSAGTVISLFLLPVVKTLGQGNDARGWQLSFILIGVVAMACFMITFLFTRERVKPPKAQRPALGADLKDLVTNKPWLILLATTLTFILFVATRSTATAHYFKYFVGTQELSLPFFGTKQVGYEWMVSVFNGVGQVAAIVGVLILTPLTKLVGKKTAFIAMFVIAVVSTAAFFVVKPDQVLLLFVLQVFGSITGGPLSALIWSMYADTADYGEWKNGRRATGLVFSASTFGQKVGWALGSAIAGWMLSGVGFVPNIEQSEEVKHGLVLLVSLIPAGLGLVSIGIVSFYTLNEKKVAEIGAELKARRIAAGEEPASN